jgi:hypothetical protein
MISNSQELKKGGIPMKEITEETGLESIVSKSGKGKLKGMYKMVAGALLGTAMAAGVAGTTGCASGGNGATLIPIAQAQSKMEPVNEATNATFIQQLAINLRGPKRQGAPHISTLPYDNVLKIIEVNPNLYMVVSEYFDCTSCLPQALPHSRMVTYLSVTPGANVPYDWRRRESMTNFVSSDMDGSYNRISARTNSQLFSDNDKNRAGEYKFLDSQIPAHQDGYTLNATKVVPASSLSPLDVVQAEEALMLANSLYGRRGPWSILTAQPVAKNSQGKGNWEIVVYEVGENDDNAHQYLNAKLDLRGQGDIAPLVRDPNRSVIRTDGQMGAEIFLVPPCSGMMPTPEFKVDNNSVSSSQVYLPKIKGC